MVWASMEIETDAATMVLMLDTGWRLTQIAEHFEIDVKEVQRLIVKQVRQERNTNAARFPLPISTAAQGQGL